MGELIEKLYTFMLGTTSVTFERNQPSSSFSSEDEYHLQTDRVRLDLNETQYIALTLALIVSRSCLDSYKKP